MIFVTECAEHGLRGEPFAQKLYGFAVFFHDFLGLQPARQPQGAGDDCIAIAVTVP